MGETRAWRKGDLARFRGFDSGNRAGEIVTLTQEMQRGPNAWDWIVECSDRTHIPVAEYELAPVAAPPSRGTAETDDDAAMKQRIAEIVAETERIAADNEALAAKYGVSLGAPHPETPGGEP